MQRPPLLATQGTSRSAHRCHCSPSCWDVASPSSCVAVPLVGAVGPPALADLAVHLDEPAHAVHLPIPPLAVVAPAVAPGQNALARLLVGDVLALVLAAVGPREGPVAVHATILPLALIAAAIRPGVRPRAVHAVFVELAGVGRPISPGKCPHARLEAGHVLPIVLSTIWPRHRAIPVLLVVLPLPVVNG